MYRAKQESTAVYVQAFGKRRREGKTCVTSRRLDKSWQNSREQAGVCWWENGAPVSVFIGDVCKHIGSGLTKFSVSIRC